MKTTFLTLSLMLSLIPIGTGCTTAAPASEREAIRDQLRATLLISNAVLSNGGKSELPDFAPKKSIAPAIYIEPAGKLVEPAKSVAPVKDPVPTPSPDPLFSTIDKLVARAADCPNGVCPVQTPSTYQYGQPYYYPVTYAGGPCPNGVCSVPGQCGSANCVAGACQSGACGSASNAHSYGDHGFSGTGPVRRVVSGVRERKPLRTFIGNRRIFNRGCR